MCDEMKVCNGYGGFFLCTVTWFVCSIRIGCFVIRISSELFDG